VALVSDRVSHSVKNKQKKKKIQEEEEEE